MRALVCLFALTLALAGFALADHSYEGVASVHDIMEVVQKPAMDSLAEMMKKGGPQNEDDWKVAKRHASILAESTQLLLMGGRVKDDVWTDGALKVIAGAKQTMQASDSQDGNAWRAGVGAMGRGCRGCHNVHKPKKE
jgi:hypothetical protein